MVEHGVNGEIDAKTSVGTMVDHDVGPRKKRAKTSYVQRSGTKVVPGGQRDIAGATRWSTVRSMAKKGWKNKVCTKVDLDARP